MPSPPESPERFPATRWSLVVNATDASDSQSQARQALSELCRIYWLPLYSFIRRSGLGAEDAEDATQDYLARVIERRQFDRADPAKGRLRSYLLTDLKFFLNDRRKTKAAKKRGGDAVLVPLDAETAEGRYLELAGDGPAPEALFDRSWAITLLETVLERLGRDYRESGREELFAALRPMLQAGVAESYSEVAERVGMSVGTVKVAAHRLRKRYQAELRRQIAATIEEEESIDEELRYLFEALAVGL